LSRANQPTAYLVDKLRQEETLKLSLLTQQKTLQGNLNTIESLYKTSQEECQLLKERLTELLHHRGELNTMKGLLELWRQQQMSEEDGDNDDDTDIDNDDDDDDDDDDILLPETAVFTVLILVFEEAVEVEVAIACDCSDDAMSSRW